MSMEASPPKEPTSADDTPSATPTPPQPAEQPYSIFDRRQKALIVLLVSVAATFSGFASNIYFPALPTLAADLGVSIELVNLTVTSYLIFQGLAPSLWAPLSDVRGRRVAYCCTFLVFLGACVGLGEARTYAAVLVLRCLQSAGSASTIAIGSGVIGDITTRADRGGLMGVFQAGLLVPVAAGPVIGGALAGSLGWRSVFWFLAVYSGVFLVALVFLLPETLRSVVGNGGRTPSGLIARFPLTVYQRTTKVEWDPAAAPSEAGAKKRIDVLGPLRILVSKQAAPVIGFLAIHYAVWQMSITVMSTLFQDSYGLSETQIGLTFIANGAGSMIGTLITGKLLDRDYRPIQARHEAQSQSQSQSQAESQQHPSQPQPLPPGSPETDLERGTTEQNNNTTTAAPSSSPTTTTTTPSASSAPPFNLSHTHLRLRLLPVFSLLQSLSLLLFGWSLHYPSLIPLAIPIIASFLTGAAAVASQAAVTTYLVDIFADRSAAAAAGASLNLARCLCAAGGTAGVMPLVGRVGVGWAFTVCGGVLAVLAGVGVVVLEGVGGLWW